MTYFGRRLTIGFIAGLIAGLLDFVAAYAAAPNPAVFEHYRLLTALLLTSTGLLVTGSIAAALVYHFIKLIPHLKGKTFFRLNFATILALGLVIFIYARYVWVFKIYQVGTHPFFTFFNLIGMVLLFFPLTWVVCFLIERLTSLSRKLQYLPRLLVLTVSALLLIPLIAVIYSFVDETVRPSEQPFICILLVDTLRADHCSCYGYGRKTTPFIDRLAENGTIFERCFSQAPWTKPSVATLFTGFPPARHNTMRIFDSLPDEANTLAEVLNSNGYVTVANSANHHITPDFNFGQGIDFFVTDQDTVFLNQYLGSIGTKVFDGIYESYLIEAHTQLYGYPAVKERARNQTEQVLLTVSLLNNRPTFVYVHYMEPHAPYTPSQRFATVFGEPIDDPTFLPDAFNVEHTFLVEPESQYPINDSQTRELVRRYDCAIRQNDDAINFWYNEMDRRDRWGDSLMVLIADHGEEFMDHGFLYHNRALYQESIHVPLIIWDSRAAKRPARIETNVAVADVMPTVLDWAALSNPTVNEDFYGISLLSSLSGSSLQEGRRIISELDRDVYATRESKQPWNEPSGYIVSEGIIIDEYKLIRDHNRNKTFLFDLTADPSEKTPLDELTEETETLNAVLTDMLNRWERSALTGGTAVVDEEEWGKMKDFGYVR
jgi:arylsulfatase A-like enzyme